MQISIFGLQTNQHHRPLETPRTPTASLSRAAFTPPQSPSVVAWEVEVPRGHGAIWRQKHKERQYGDDEKPYYIHINTKYII